MTEPTSSSAPPRRRRRAADDSARSPGADAFLLAGEDDVARSERLQGLLEESLDRAARDFNLDRLSARDADPSILATLLDTPPLLAERRVVVLEDAEEASAEVARVVAGFLRAPGATTRLIALFAGKPAGQPWSEFRRSGSEEVFDAPRGAAAIKARIKQEIQRAGRQISPEAANLLAELNPEAGAALQQEIAKVLAHAGDRKRVDVADVEAVAVSSVGGNRYTFIDLVGMGRRREALAELRVLLEDGESPIFLVTLLTHHFLMLGGIRACEARGIRSSEAIAQHLRKSSWLLDKKNHHIENYEPPRVQARRYTREAIDRWLSGLLQLDLALKSSRLPPAALIEGTVLRLMSGATAVPA